jgi:hypothetical protein
VDERGEQVGLLAAFGFGGAFDGFAVQRGHQRAAAAVVVGAGLGVAGVVEAGQVGVGEGADPELLADPGRDHVAARGIAQQGRGEAAGQHGQRVSAQRAQPVGLGLPVEGVALPAAAPGVPGGGADGVSQAAA